MTNEIKRAYIEVKKALEAFNKTSKNAKFLLLRPNGETHEGNWVVDKGNARELMKEWKTCKTWDKQWDTDLKMLIKRDYLLYVSHKDEYIAV